MYFHNDRCYISWNNLKKKLNKIQGRELARRMAVSSKMDRIVTKREYSYSGKMMNYLSQLNFKEARAIFMSRYRMWPTKENFPGRWKGDLCNVCGLNDSDEHILTCPGYSDIVDGKFDFEVFWDDDVLGNAEKLRIVARTVLLLIERMEHIQNCG